MLDRTLATLFDIAERLNEQTPTRFTTGSRRGSTDAFRPRALFERFNLEVISTTDAANDELNGIG